ncbi:hypothetical protein [Microbacterium sp.]|uniref:hypothetical protein n=1 Tax=Microbacterium sp. TaxID=51671 RepID=UPI003A90099D
MVDNRVKNVKKKTSKSSTTNHITNNGSGTESTPPSETPAWLWVVLWVGGVIACAIFAVRWNEFVFLASSTLLGVTLGTLLGVLAWPLTRSQWNAASTLVVVEAGIASLSFVAIWVGIKNVVKAGWSLDSLRAAIMSATDGIPFTRAVTPVLDALGSDGVALAVQLLIASVVSIALPLALARSQYEWWMYLAAKAGRLRKKRAKKAVKFAKVDAWVVVRRLVLPALLAVVGVFGAWGALPNVPLPFG